MVLSWWDELLCTCFLKEILVVRLVSGGKEGGEK